MTHPSLTLEKRIAAELVSFDGRVGVYADDLNGNRIEIRADEPWETASCIKSYILGALYERIEQGEICREEMLSIAPEHIINGSGVLRDMVPGSEISVYNASVLMIIVSDNTATNLLIARLGLDRINEFIRRKGFLNTVLHNPIDFVKYDRLGTTTPRDYGTLFTYLQNGTLVSPEADREMLAIYRRQHYHSLLAGEIPAWFLDSEDTGEEELISIASKSGSMDACRNDGGIISTPYGDYIAVVFTGDFSDPMYYDNHPSYRFGSRVSRLLFDSYLTLEGRFRL